MQSEKINQILFLQKNLKTLKQLSSHDVQRNRTVSMSSPATVSSEESPCTVPKLFCIDFEEEEDTHNFYDREHCLD